MSIFGKIAQRLAGARRVSGRDLQLRAETLLLYALASKSTPVFGDFSPDVLSNCADLVNSDRHDLPNFEQQSSIVRTFLLESVIKSLRTTSNVFSIVNDPSDVGQAKFCVEKETKKLMGFVPIVKPSSIPNAGLGLHVQGSAPAGSLIGLYPGTCYMPSDLAYLPGFPCISQNNDYLLWRYDGIVINGKDALSEAAISSGEYPALTVQELSEQLISHPFSLAHRINHPSVGSSPNCLQFMLDLRVTTTISDLRTFIPNKLFTPDDSKSRTFFERLQNAGVRQRVPSTSAFVSDPASMLSIPTIAMIAVRDIQDEEVLMNYRYNPAGPGIPSWYHDCDPASSQRRWMKTGTFL